MYNENAYRLGSKRSTIREIFEYAKKRSEEIGAENVFDFSIGNPYFPAPASVKTAIVEILETMDSNFIHGYMPNDGYPAVRQTVAEYINTNFGDNISGDNIIMTVGAAGGLNACLKALLNEGDEVIVPAPYRCHLPRCSH